MPLAMGSQGNLFHSNLIYNLCQHQNNVKAFCCSSNVSYSTILASWENFHFHPRKGITQVCWLVMGKCERKHKGIAKQFYVLELPKKVSIVWLKKEKFGVRFFANWSPRNLNQNLAPPKKVHEVSNPKIFKPHKVLFTYLSL